MVETATIEAAPKDCNKSSASKATIKLSSRINTFKPAKGRSSSCGSPLPLPLPPANVEAAVARSDSSADAICRSGMRNSASKPAGEYDTLAVPCRSKGTTRRSNTPEMCCRLVRAGTFPKMRHLRNYKERSDWLSGRRYISAALAESIAADLHSSKDQSGPLHTMLSTREFQIFCKLAPGMAVNRIADELSLSVKTVSTYRGRVLEKMGFKSNADITAYALRNGLIR
jgi:DNA-binding CsgD family transcriptional regulator